MIAVYILSKKYDFLNSLRLKILDLLKNGIHVSTSLSSSDERDNTK